jgi:hypothetical protein
VSLFAIGQMYEEETDFVEQPDGTVNGMLCDDSDEDLFGSEQVAASKPPPVSSSAILAWEEGKRREIESKDREESEVAEKLKGEASSALKTFHEKLSVAQSNRAKHNRELDAQKIAEQKKVPDNRWERVVEQIDFSRADLHVKDVSKMRSLLLQLKQGA